jgi:hypothetical protein
MLINDEEVSLTQVRMLESLVATFSRHLIDNDEQGIIRELAELGYEITIATEPLTDDQIRNICQKFLGARSVPGK